mmetsp:Transcript_25615/g.71917  ORF Transcript_25615/g.71917 Transcript_25615/m.71917 type:complete len:274 (+) Transcript_25615:39-860(+)
MPNTGQYNPSHGVDALRCWPGGGIARSQHPAHLLVQEVHPLRVFHLGDALILNEQRREKDLGIPVQAALARGLEPWQLAHGHPHGPRREALADALRQRLGDLPELRPPRGAALGRPLRVRRRRALCARAARLGLHARRRLVPVFLRGVVEPGAEGVGDEVRRGAAADEVVLRGEAGPRELRAVEGGTRLQGVDARVQRGQDAVHGHPEESSQELVRAILVHVAAGDHVQQLPRTQDVQGQQLEPPAQHHGVGRHVAPVIMPGVRRHDLQAELQ